MSEVRRKKIFFITHLYYPSLGGAERVFQRLAEGLNDRGHEVTVLTSDALSTEHYFSQAKNNLAAKEKINGVLVVRESVCSPIYRVMRFIDAPLRRLGRAGVFLRPLTFGPHFYRSWAFFIRQPFDLVIAGPVPTSSIYYGFIYRMRHPQARFIVVPCLHIGDKLHTSPLNIAILRRADRVITLTKREKSYLCSRGVKEEKMFVLSSGVDEHLLKNQLEINGDKKEQNEKIKLSGFERAPKDYVLYLGQEGEHKRIPFLVKAMIKLWDAGYENPLVIAGARTNYSASIDQLICHLPAAYRKKIIRFNNITEEEKVHLLDSCLILVNPSAYESFGIVFLEAWARGKPVIGADLPVLREIIRHGKNGLIFYRESIDDLSEKIRFLLDNGDYARRMGEEGRQEVLTYYTWQRIILSLAEFLEL
jgi:glycosyltransferase involved in cell wall biosynthesis